MSFTTQKIHCETANESCIKAVHSSGLKIYIAEKTSVAGDNGMTYVSVIAMFDMCKIGDLTNVFQRKTKALA